MKRYILAVAIVLFARGLPAETLTMAAQRDDPEGLSRKPPGL